MASLRQLRGGYVDCGAYDGDTVEKFIDWSGGNYSKIFAVEADPVNFAALEKFISEKNYKAGNLNKFDWA